MPAPIIKESEVKYPRLVGRQNGRLVVDVEPGNRQTMTEEAWAELQDEGGAGRFRLSKAVQAMEEALPGVSKAEGAEAVRRLGKTVGLALASLESLSDKTKDSGADKGESESKASDKSEDKAEDEPSFSDLAKGKSKK